MLGSLAWSRLWLLFLMIAVIAYAACATGAAPCAVGRPIGLTASLLAAGFAFLAPDAARTERDLDEPERVDPAARGRRPR